MNTADLDGIGPYGKPYKVVICEDKRIEAQQLRGYLESKRYQVLEIFENGRDLVTWYKQHPGEADLIVLDIIMPVLDGYAAFWEIKEMKPFPRIVFISIENTSSVIKNVLNLGAYDFITKPFKREIILERVGKVVRRPPPA